MKDIRRSLFVAMILSLTLVSGCEQNQKVDSKQNQLIAEEEIGQTKESDEFEGLNGEIGNTLDERDKINVEDENMNQIQENAQERISRLEGYFDGITYTEAVKNVLSNNPLMTQRFGADPYVIEYDGRAYVYMTGDVLQYDDSGAVTNNSYSQINKLNVISSADLVNWTDHGTIYAAGPQGAAKWGNNSWAPAVACKEIDGQMKFFIYFANGGNGIGVITSDSPTGPFVDPLGHALISRQTPNCSNVAWLFDPAVLVDDDGRAYLYFGGGIPDEKYADPGTARVVELAEDMISLACDPIPMEVPYLFEDSGINKIGDMYYYSYCSNFNVSEEDTTKLGFSSGQIITMTSKNPMGPFTLQGPILKNPGEYFGCYGNNHHCMFEFKGRHYMAYHTQLLESRLGIAGGYRSTNINEVILNEDGSINMIKADETGVEQLESLNPYQKVEAETMATMAGVSTIQCDEQSLSCGSGNMAVTQIDTGDWIALKGVDFGTRGAKKFVLRANLPEENTGVIQIRLDRLFGEVVGYVELQTDSKDQYVEITEELLKDVTGEHDLYFVFYGTGYELDSWYFE